LRSGNAALFLLIREKVLAGLRGAGGMVTRSSFDEKFLREVLAAARATAS
jgi:uncharacterized membrane protein